MKPNPLSFSLIMLASAPFLQADSENRLFYDAVRAEAAGNLDSAIESYESSAQIAHSANLHGNLANLYFKKEMLGQSILHYRKALVLDPDNRNLSENLSFATETARVQTTSLDISSGYFRASSVNFWSIATSAFFWGGLLLISILFFFQVELTFKLISFLVWMSLSGFGVWGILKSTGNHNLQMREVIAIDTQGEKDSNGSKSLKLRRFAGNGSTANTSVVPGESLFLDITESGLPKDHRSPNGERWFLVRTLEGRKRGWMKENELGRILAPQDSQPLKDKARFK
jgi:hypothetical protein